VRLLADVALCWADCHERQERGEVLVCVASRCDEPTWGRECLQKFVIKPGLTMMDVVTEERCEIYGGSKKGHLRALHKKTGVPFERMCFFDDQQGNVDDVAELGVHAFLTPEGVTKEIFAKGLRAARGGSSSML
jgi:magnesium-dependent phosphatase 1